MEISLLEESKSISFSFSLSDICVHLISIQFFGGGQWKSIGSSDVMSSKHVSHFQVSTLTQLNSCSESVRHSLLMMMMMMAVTSPTLNSRHIPRFHQKRMMTMQQKHLSPFYLILNELLNFYIPYGQAKPYPFPIFILSSD